MSNTFIYRVQLPDYYVLRLDVSIEAARKWAKQAFPKLATVRRQAEREFCGDCDCSPCVCKKEEAA